MSVLVCQQKIDMRAFPVFQASVFSLRFYCVMKFSFKAKIDMPDKKIPAALFLLKTQQSPKSLIVICKHHIVRTLTRQSLHFQCLDSDKWGGSISVTFVDNEGKE